MATREKLADHPRLKRAFTVMAKVGAFIVMGVSAIGFWGGLRNLNTGLGVSNDEILLFLCGCFLFGIGMWMFAQIDKAKARAKD